MHKVEMLAKNNQEEFDTGTEWLNLSKRGGMDGVFQGMAGLLGGISLDYIFFCKQLRCSFGILFLFLSLFHP